MSFHGKVDSSLVELTEAALEQKKDFTGWSSNEWQDYNDDMESAAEAGLKPVSPETREKIASGAHAFVNLSDVVEGMLTVDGKPFSFTREGDRRYLKGLYDLFSQYPQGCKNTILIAGRQVEKSTTQSAKSIALGLINPAYKTLYVAPRFDQVTVFSQQRFKPMCEDSLQLQGAWIQPSRTLWQVSAKQFTNGAFFNFRSCYHNADNARGITANHLLVDEIQDIVPDAIPVLEQCQSHSSEELQYNTYAGTPKSTSNIITKRWENSCQFEWLSPCGGFDGIGCNHWNFLDESIIQNDKYACTKCGKELDPHIGEWVPQRPSLLETRWGFRISQLMVPFKKHKDIIAVRNDPNIPRSSYLNECIGLPYDEGETGITREVLMNACQDYRMLTLEEIKLNYADRGLPVFGGVDYGTGIGVHPSYTVVTIGTLTHTNTFKVLWMRKLKHEEAALATQPRRIDGYFRKAGAAWIGCDWGFGAQSNERLIAELGWHRFGSHNLLLEFKYAGQTAEASWNGREYVVDRNQVMGRVIDSIRRPEKEWGIVFFNFEDIREFEDDFTSVYMEYNEKTGRTKYEHKLPDDGFHSVNYAFLASRQHRGLLVKTMLPQI